MEHLQSSYEPLLCCAEPGQHLMCIPDSVSDNDVQGHHLIGTGEAGQVGSQSLTEPLSFLPGALPAQPLFVEHLRIQTSSDKEMAVTPSAHKYSNDNLSDQMQKCTEVMPSQNYGGLTSKY